MRTIGELMTQYASQWWPLAIAVIAVLVYGRLTYGAIRRIDARRATLPDGGLRARHAPDATVATDHRDG